MQRTPISADPSEAKKAQVGHIKPLKKKNQNLYVPLARVHRKYALSLQVVWRTRGTSTRIKITRDVLFQLYVETRLSAGAAALYRILRGVGPAEGHEES